MTTNKKDNSFIIPKGTVNFYTLDAPFGAHEAEFNEKGMVTNGKLGLRVTLDPTSKETQALLKELKGNVSIKEVAKNGVISVQLSASTKFKPQVADATGNLIAAPTDVRTNAGDVMEVTLSVSEYGYEFEGKKAKALRLNAVKILKHDTSKRVIDAKEGTAKATFLDALNDSTDNLAALKG